MDKIGLVSVTYNSSNILQEFLDCVFNQTYNNFILYIIDNASSDNTLSILKKKNDPRIIVIENEVNFGVAKANNQGVIKALEHGCDQILFLNNDIEFDEDLIEILINKQNEEDCSLAAPKIMYFNDTNKIWYAGSWFIKIKGYLPSCNRMNEYDHGQYDISQLVEYAPTCCLLVKKEVFSDIGLMNEKYFVYFDDTDFLYRVFKNKKHKTFYFPDAKLYHKVGSLTKSFNLEDEKIFRGDFFIKQNTKNHIYFLKQIGGIFAYLFIVWLLFKNNVRFITSPMIRKDLNTWKLINRSFFEGLRM